MGDIFNEFFGGGGGGRRNHNYPHGDDPLNDHRFRTGDPFDPFRDPFFSGFMMHDPFAEIERSMRHAGRIMEQFNALHASPHYPGDIEYSSPRDRMIGRRSSWDGPKIEEITDDSDTNDQRPSSKPIVTHPSDALVVPDSQNDQHREQNLLQRPAQPHGGAFVQGFSQVYSFNMDGTGRREERRIYRDSAGNFEDKKARHLNGKTVAVTERRGPDGKPEILEDYVNVDGSEIDQFEREWRSGASRRPMLDRPTPDIRPRQSDGPLQIQGSYGQEDDNTKNKKSWRSYLPKIF